MLNAHFVRRFSVFASLLVAQAMGMQAAGSAQGETAGERVSLDEIRTFNRAQCDALQAVAVTAVVRETYRSRVGESSQIRDRIANALAGSPVTDLSHGRGHPGAGSDPSLDSSLIIADLNKQTSVRRRATIDFVRSLVRYDDEDLRDVSALLRANELSEANLPALSRTQSLIMNGTRSVRIVPSQSLAVIAPFHGDHAHAIGRRGFGFVPDWVFDGTYAVDLTVADGSGAADGPSVILTCRDPERPRPAPVAVFWVRPSLGFRVERMLAYDEDGQVTESFAASDYRQVNGQYFPFAHRTVRAREGISDYYTREVTVESIDCHPDVLRIEDIPEGYVVQDLVAGKVNLPE